MTRTIGGGGVRKQSATPHAPKSQPGNPPHHRQNLVAQGLKTPFNIKVAPINSSTALDKRCHAMPLAVLF